MHHCYTVQVDLFVSYLSDIFFSFCFVGKEHTLHLNSVFEITLPISFPVLQSSGYQSTNGTGVSTSRPTSPPVRPSSRQSGSGGVEIVITGRTRSRTDLCPDVPRSKFEHSV